MSVSGRAGRRALLACVVVILGGVSCGDGGGPPARGLSSRQVLAIRDPSFQFYGQESDSTVLYSLFDPASNTTNYYTVDVDSGAIVGYGINFPTYGQNVTIGGVGLLCFLEQSGVGDQNQLRILNTQTGDEVVIADVAISLGCPTADQPIVSVFRQDPAGHYVVYRGRYDQALPLVPIPLTLVSLVDIGDDTFDAVASPPDAPDALGIYRIDFATGTATPLVPATLSGGAWAPGGTGDGPLASSSLAQIPNLGATPIANDQFLYARAMSDGSSTMFVGPFLQGSPSEMALFPMADLALRLYASGGGPLNVDLPSWQRGGTPRDPDSSATVMTWDARAQRLLTCPVPAQRLLDANWSPAGHRVAFLTNALQDQLNPVTGPLLLVSDTTDPTGPCHLLAEDGVDTGGFSPQGGALYWIVTVGIGNRTLWLAAGDGSGARQIGSGDISWAEFATDTELQLVLGGDLVWLDVRDNPVRLHSIAEGVFGDAAEELARTTWIVAGYDFSQQDRTGTLGLANHDTGAKRFISNSVAWYRELWQAGPYPNSIESSGRILYMVRGRNPSPQDGLWLATATADDLR
jgi:hypothetical protein